jgi:hypothetical protein
MHSSWQRIPHPPQGNGTVCRRCGGYKDEGRHFRLRIFVLSVAVILVVSGGVFEAAYAFGGLTAGEPSGIALVPSVPIAVPIPAPVAVPVPAPVAHSTGSVAHSPPPQSPSTEHPTKPLIVGATVPSNASPKRGGLRRQPRP